MKLKIKIPSYTKTQAENDQVELAKIKEQKKLLEQREEEIKNRLGAWMEKSLQADRKGHFVMSVLSPEGNPLHLMRQARTKVTLNQERALEFLKSRKLTSAIQHIKKIAPEITEDQILEVAEKHADWMITEYEVVEESELSQLVVGKKISMEDFESLCSVERSYAMVYLPEDKFKEYVEKESDNNASVGNGEKVHSSERERDATLPHRKTRK